MQLRFFQDFTENFTRNLPKLAKDQRDVLEGKLSLEECWKALICLQCRKLPGKDGFTGEFKNSLSSSWVNNFVIVLICHLMIMH